MSMQSLKKIGQKLHKLSPETTFLHQSRAITLLFNKELSPFAIPNHSSPISMSMQSLKKTGQKLLKLEFRNVALTDGWMYVLTDGQTLKISKFSERIT